MRRCCVVPAQGKLKSRRLLGSDRQDQFVERDRQSPMVGSALLHLASTQTGVLH
jgi:hypothetical protein